MAVIGAGYTGAAAALELARRGRAVVLLDAAAPGSEASSRNGGMAIPGTKGELPDLLAAPGGRAQWHESVAAFAQLEQLVTDEHIDCDWVSTGHVELAVHPRHARRLQTAAEAHQRLGERAHFVGREELATEIGSPRFAGGLVIERSAALQPAVLLQGLLAAARRAGAVV
ncbi:MAG TPA: FAD-dependent oxidoreductase, partial [Acidimicrobiales bacterium]|nr:FAD-dependent oxidoreductase [Acidimicrobiales bacterium]